MHERAWGRSRIPEAPGRKPCKSLLLALLKLGREVILSCLNFAVNKFKKVTGRKSCSIAGRWTSNNELVWRKWKSRTCSYKKWENSSHEISDYQARKRKPALLVARLWQGQYNEKWEERWPPSQKTRIKSKKIVHQGGRSLLDIGLRCTSSR